MADDPILEVENLTVQYETKGDPITAVTDVSFSISQGEFFGLVGESGCGKTTVASAIIHGLDSNGEITSGKIRYQGDEIQDLSERKLNEKIRWNEISWIPQGAMNSLNPLIRISEQATEIAEVHSDQSDDEAIATLKRLFEIVGLQPERVTDYPHQFSGGMLQRALIALALFLEPKIIIADEPTTALDVIMQDQVFKYLEQIKEELNTTLFMITHDISVVFESCDRAGVMHAGQLAEIGSVHEIYHEPHHPYSILLQRAFPDVSTFDQELEVIPGTPPQNTGEVDYCTFAGRCPWEVEDCTRGAPPMKPTDSTKQSDSVGANSHSAACIRRNEIRDLLAKDAEQSQKERP